VKLILPALTEATSPHWRPIKYSLFPPLGLATLAAHLDPDLEIALQDEHVEKLDLHDHPDLVVIQVYITNAYRAYRIADHYRARGAYVVLGGLHVTSLPDEAARHGDTICLGPGDHTFPRFLRDFAAGGPLRRYESTTRTLEGQPPIRRDLIRRQRYLVPNSIVVSRGCPHHCTFCYKDAFFSGGRSFYTQRVDAALAEIARLPGRHLYFLDDHLLGNPRFARELFHGMRGMGRVFQGAATVDSILRDDLIEAAAAAGLRSLFVGFETLSPSGLAGAGKRQNLGRSYRDVVQRLSDLGIMINGSFVFGLDGDDGDVFARTVDWAVRSGLTTATFHILTPYPGTALFAALSADDRIATRDWDLYDTRHVVYRPSRLSPGALQRGYDWSYAAFYRWSSIFEAALTHDSTKHRLKHVCYSAGWKKFERAWDFVIRIKQLSQMRPLLEAVLSPLGSRRRGRDGAAQDGHRGPDQLDPGSGERHPNGPTPRRQLPREETGPPQPLAPVGSQRAVRRAGHRVLVDPGGRREEARDEIDALPVARRGDDDAPARHQPEPGLVGPEGAKGLGRVHLHQVVGLRHQVLEDGDRGDA
jgi:radical SAM superfamily enzyme YgiQ (UPF0313 family)